MKARGERSGGEEKGRGVPALPPCFIRLGAFLESLEFECNPLWRNE
jgi:hypothetical protein